MTAIFLGVLAACLSNNAAIDVASGKETHVSFQQLRARLRSASNIVGKMSTAASGLAIAAVSNAL
jgi:TPP-dependent pyruvate/acetoin dehydrogenase alpha subunit